LLKKDGVSISLSTFKRRLKELGLSRRRQEIDIEAVTRLICEEIAGAGRLAGYRCIWHTLRIRHGLHVPRNLVAQILKEIDPVGVDLRKSRLQIKKKIWGVCPHTRGLRPLVPSYNFRAKLDAQNICRKWHFWASNFKDFPPNPLFMRGMLATRGLQPLLSPSDILSHREVPFQKIPHPGRIVKKGPGVGRITITGVFTT
jgi:hypothetical protein